MAVIESINHSTNDFSQWDNVTSAGDFSVTSAAAMAGTSYGMQTVIDDVQQLRGYQNLSYSSNVLRFRFYFDPNSITMSNGHNFYIARLEDGGSTYVYLRFKYTTAAGYQVDGRIYDDSRSGIVDTAFHNLSDGPHVIELEVNRATTTDADDATVEIWVDGYSQGVSSGVDLYDQWPLDKVFLGVTSNNQAGTSGTLYFDQLIVNDDGSPIGEHRETEITTLQPADSGFVSNFISSETTDAETIYAAQGAGTNICLESVTINCMNPATVIIGAGSTGGSVDTEIIGPIDVTEIAPPYTVEFTRPVVLDANTALTIDTGSAVLVQCTATGYVK